MPGGHAGQVVAQVAEHGLEVGRLLEVLPLVEADVLDPLALAGDVGQRLVGALAVLVVDLAEVYVLVAVEPHADLGGGHVQVEPELVLAVLAVLLLALHHHEQLVLGLLGRVEHGDIDGVGLLLVRRADADPVLRAGLNLALGVAVVLYQVVGRRPGRLRLLPGQL